MTSGLYLLFNLGSERFAVSTSIITEIIPLVEVTQVPTTPEYICGVFNYRGETIPVIDTNQLLYRQDHNQRICTRILVLETEAHEGTAHVGLIAEKVNQTTMIDTTDIRKHTLTRNSNVYLGKTVSDELGEIQIIDLDQLVKDALNDSREHINKAQTV
jgi:chemotaxis-related protein WspB